MTDNTIDSEVRRSVWLIAIKARNIKADMNEITDELMATIAQEAKAFGGCRNCYGKGYATVRKGTTAKGKTWDLRTHINYCSCDRGKQLQQVVAQEANKARKELLLKLKQAPPIDWLDANASIDQWLTELDRQQGGKL